MDLDWYSIKFHSSLHTCCSLLFCRVCVNMCLCMHNFFFCLFCSMPICLLFLCLCFKFLLHFFFIFYNQFIFYTLYIIPPPIQLPRIPHLTLPPQQPVSMWMFPPPPYVTSKHPASSSLLRVRCIISGWTQPSKSSTVCVLRASYQLVYAVWLVVPCLRELGGPD